MAYDVAILTLLVILILSLYSSVSYVIGFYRGYKKGLITGEDGILQQIIKQSAGATSKHNVPMGFHPADDDPPPTRH